MAKDIVTKAEILGGEIDVRATFGQTVKVTVSPDPYTGDTEVTPSDQTQVLATKKKFVQDDITVLPAPTETLSTTSNGQFTPSSGKVGFSAVTVDVNPDLRPLSISENGTYEPEGFDGYSSVTADIEPILETLTATENGLYLPPDGADGFDRANVNVPVPSGSTTITENGTYDVEQYASAVVEVPSAEWTTAGIADGSEPIGEIYLDGIDLRVNAFSGCTGITKIKGEDLKPANGIFSGCQNLTEWHCHFRNVTIYPNSISPDCPNLKKVVWRNDGGGNWGSALQNCGNLEVVDTDLKSIQFRSNTFTKCYKLATLIIRRTSAITGLENVAAFTDTPFRGYNGLSGTIYVPNSLINTYKTTGNWKTLYEEGHVTFVAIEGSIYESTYADGTAVES